MTVTIDDINKTIKIEGSPSLEEFSNWFNGFKSQVLDWYNYRIIGDNYRPYIPYTPYAPSPTTDPNTIPYNPWTTPWIPNQYQYYEVICSIH